MENIHNFDEEKLTTKKSSKKLLVILTVIVVIVAILVLGFCNFTDKYGVIPTNEKLSSGDKIPYVIMLEGVPEDIHYEKEVGEISLSYSKTVFDMPADVTAFFGGGCRLTGFVYTFDGIRANYLFTKYDPYYNSKIHARYPTYKNGKWGKV